MLMKIGWMNRPPPILTLFFIPPSKIKIFQKTNLLRIDIDWYYNASLYNAIVNIMKFSKNAKNAKDANMETVKFLVLKSIKE